MAYDSDGCFEENLYLSINDKYLQYLNVSWLFMWGGRGGSIILYLYFVIIFLIKISFRII